MLFVVIQQLFFCFLIAIGQADGDRNDPLIVSPLKNRFLSTFDGLLSLTSKAIHHTHPTGAAAGLDSQGFAGSSCISCCIAMRLQDRLEATVYVGFVYNIRYTGA